jgi:hypothetical protein
MSVNLIMCVSTNIEQIGMICGNSLSFPTIDSMICQYLTSKWCCGRIDIR